MTEQREKAAAFHALHAPGKPFVLFNIWDAGSAAAVERAGAAALATGSWSVAAAHGLGDGERTPLALAIENLARIVASTALPVSVDLEAGYGAHPREVGETVAQAVSAGAVGCNLEDSFPETGRLREVSDQVERLGEARRAVGRAGSFFINARTDVFFQAPAAEHDEAMIDAAALRARAYAAAGADGLFAPGLKDLALIARLASASPVPLNIMVDENSPSVDALANAGVARISHGPGPYLLAMKSLESAARTAFASAQRSVGGLGAADPEAA